MSGDEIGSGHDDTFDTTHLLDQHDYGAMHDSSFDSGSSFGGGSMFED